MSKKQFRSQASSGRAFGGGTFASGFGTSAFGSSTPLSYITEPPDLSGISDPNVVVAFKNLAKKDSTTKAKALEDLQAFLTSRDHEVEDALLEAWVKLYPRLSIDNSRRVRQLAHSLLGNIASRCGKRVAKHMPKLAGPWLAGAQDSDRAAARAAVDALNQVFTTQEKLQNVGKAFQQPIVEYCKDALLNESVQSLSDERTVSADDAQATYSRVVATSLAVIANQLNNLPAEDLEKQHDVYASVLGESKVWEFAAYKDVFVRRQVHRLLRVSLSKHRKIVEDNLETISGAYIGKALAHDQTGSANEFMSTMVALTDAFPHAWTTSYSSKRPAIQRLKQCLKRGSQSGPPEFWTNVWELLSKIPAEVFPKTYDEVKDLLESMHDGISQKEERFNALTAWEAYFKLADKLSSSLTSEEQDKVMAKMVLPVVEQYLHPAQDLSQWSVSGSRPSVIISKAAYCKALPAALEGRWPEYAKSLLQMMKTSLPEQSKDFEKSQSAVASAGSRWAHLQAELVRGEYDLPGSLLRIFAQTTREITKESLQLLRSRNGKPFGAAAVVNELMDRGSEVLMGDDQARADLTSFVMDDLPNLLYSPSQRQLLSLLYHFEKDSKFEEAWNKVATSLADRPDSSEKLAAFRNLLASPRIKSAADLASKNAEIQSMLKEQYHECIKSGENWTFIADSMHGVPDAASRDTCDAILSDLTSALTISDRTNAALNGLAEIAKNNRPLIKHFMSTSQGSQLIPNLLILQESSDETIVRKAEATSKDVVTNDADKTSSHVVIFDVLQRSLKDLSRNALPMHAVLDMALKTINEADLDNRKDETPKRALPDLEAWDAALSPFLSQPVSQSAAITSILRGTVFLVKSDGKQSEKIARDTEGLSQAIRFAIYTSKIYSNKVLLEGLDEDMKTNLFRLFYMTVIIAKESVGMFTPNGLCSTSHPDIESEMVEFLNEAGRLTEHCVQNFDEASDSDRYSFVGSAIDHFFNASKGSDASAFHNAQAFAHALGDLESIHGSNHSKVQEYLGKLKDLYKAREIFPFVASVSALQEVVLDTKVLDRQVNELVADLTGLDLEKSPDKALEQLVLSDAFLGGPKPAVDVVAKQRLMFSMKHVIPWTQESSTPIKAATSQYLSDIVPSVDDLYGDHWAQILACIVNVWKGGFLVQETSSVDESRLTLVYSSLQLFRVLQKLMSSNEPNDDLIDAWKEEQDSAYKALMELVKQGHGLADDNDRPLQAIFGLLAQETTKWSSKPSKDISELYALLYTPSRDLQKTAFTILHSTIPTMQEQISFDAALENKTTQLPEELLSLILETPTIESLADASFRVGLPLDLQGYLFSWQLVFDHFENSSYKVKSDYIDSLKEGDHLAGLLDLTYNLLGHVRGRPVDVSKFNIQRYDYTEQEDDLSDHDITAERRMQWLLTHLYYLCLTHLPSLTKSHFLNITSRQTSLAVETWTAKYIAPLIINASLSSVSEWASTTAKDDPDSENLTVKVAMRTREVNVSYLVDEQTMAIVVRLPETYPLTGARVDGVNRVAVDEKKWQSWLRSCQGVITFSNGNLIDGLSAWRKNVTGALKGQSECAICYSIISGDKQLPSKRCSTCKNLFHSSCLFKWFKTSNASTCPLCRNPFNYG